jgi:NADH:ubiquinone oxidoreductase subunit 6 (subunit J)
MSPAAQKKPKQLSPMLPATIINFNTELVGARIFEGFFDALIAISLLLLLTLSREYVKAGTRTAKTDIDEIN